MSIPQDLNLLFYIPMSCATVFMLWVLWNLARQTKKR